MPQALVGIVLLIVVAWATSENRRAALNPRALAAGLGLQFLLALALLKLPVVNAGFAELARAVSAAQEAARVGAEFVFGYLAGGPPPFAVEHPAAVFLLAFQALPLILLAAALSALLFHWGILPALVRIIGRALSRAMNINGPTGVGVAANIFVGQIEAGLFIRPYIASLSRADLFAFLTAGLATIAGTVLALYAVALQPVLPNAFGHLVTASLISAPAAVMFARIMLPADNNRPGDNPDDRPNSSATTRPAATSHRRVSDTQNALDALVVGAADGARLITRIIAMLIVAVAVAHLANAALALAPAVGGEPLSLERILGWLLAPVAWGLGIPWREAALAGELLGVKIVLSELVAYVRMADLPPAELSPRSVLILSYAMAGFANLAGAGVLIGGIAGMAAHRRAEIAELGAKALLAGNLAAMTTGAVAGIVAGI